MKEINKNSGEQIISPRSVNQFVIYPSNPHRMLSFLTKTNTDTPSR